MKEFLQQLNARFAQLEFSCHWVYNPWEYAGASYLEYWQRFGAGPKRIVLMGMNPGPWGMAQTGIPFGEVSLVRDWLGIGAPIQGPAQQHPARPIQGWQCKRSEVSGKRLWGYLKERFDKPEAFFEIGYVANYCPLAFLEESGRNLTPDKLPRSERLALQALCDESLTHHLRLLQPSLLVGVGKWAEQRAQDVVKSQSLDIAVTSIPHPSPANPGANQGWGRELGELLDRL